MKIIKTRFDKHDIPDLPKAAFEGRIYVIQSEFEAERAVNFLLTQPIIGLDTETKPRFKPGSGMNKVALLQVSTPQTCFLFRLNQLGIPPCLIRLLEDTSIIKVGLSWHDDLMQLHRRVEFTSGTFVEIQEIIQLLGIKDLSLQKIYANLFGQKISKTQRLTNWEADFLTPAQQVYAATDAWACIQIYNEIMRLKDSGDYELIIVPEPIPPTPQEYQEPQEPKEAKTATGNRKKKRSRKSTSSSNTTVSHKESTDAATTVRTKRRYHRKPKVANSGEPPKQKQTLNNSAEA